MSRARTISEYNENHDCGISTAHSDRIGTAGSFRRVKFNPKNGPPEPLIRIAGANDLAATSLDLGSTRGNYGGT
jgi:hypothetical protein